MNKMITTIAVFVLYFSILPIAGADDEFSVNPIAILQFQERGNGIKGYGDKTADILFAKLIEDPELYIVDRNDIEKSLDEQALSLSGMVNANQVVQAGQLAGAKILITGSVVEVGKDIYVIAKIIGSETGRVLGVSQKDKMRNDFSILVETLAGKIAAVIHEKSETLMAKKVNKDMVIELTDLVARRREILSAIGNDSYK